MILKKLGDEYKLYSHDSCIATTHESPYKKLSLKNCQAIENGYDLDELAKEACNITDPLRLDSQKYKQDPYFKIGFNKGFQKALEILGDKKFSEEDVISMIEKSRETGLTSEYLILTKQQIEWDVEIEMENSLTNGYKNQPDNVIGFIAEYKSVPKLDSDGCLILKRK